MEPSLKWTASSPLKLMKMEAKKILCEIGDDSPSFTAIKLVTYSFQERYSKNTIYNKRKPGAGCFCSTFFCPRPRNLPVSGDSWWVSNRAPSPSDSQRSAPNCDHWLVPSPAVIPWNFGAPSARWFARGFGSLSFGVLYMYNSWWKIWKNTNKIPEVLWV